MSTLAPSQVVANVRRKDALWLAALSLMLLLALLPFSGYIASLPFIRAEWRMSNTQAGMVFSIYLVGYALSSLVLIPLTDRHPPQRVLLGALVLMVGGNLLFPLLARGFWTALLLRFFTGAGQVGVYIPAVRLASRRFGGNRRGTAMGILVGAGYAGTTFSYTLMGLLLGQTASWRMAFFAVALAAVVGLLLSLWVIRESNARDRTSDASMPPVATARPTGRLDLSVLRARPVMLAIVGYALHTAALYLARLWFPLLLGAMLMQQGMPAAAAAARAATLAGLMFMMGIAGSFVGGTVSDYLGRSWGATLLFALSGLCSFVAGWLLGAPPIFLIALGFVYGLTTAADSAIYLTAVIELSPPARVGSAQAVQSFIGFAVGALAPVLAGSILDFSHTSLGWVLAFGFNGLLAVMGVAALLWLRRLPEAKQMAAGKR
jgi:MFS family permease